MQFLIYLSKNSLAGYAWPQSPTWPCGSQCQTGCALIPICQDPLAGHIAGLIFSRTRHDLPQGLIKSTSQDVTLTHKSAVRYCSFNPDPPVANEDTAFLPSSATVLPRPRICWWATSPVLLAAARAPHCLPHVPIKFTN